MLRGKNLRGDALRILKTLSDPSCPDEVLANALAQASRMRNCFPTARELYACVDGNPRLALDGHLGKVVIKKEVPAAKNSSLAELGRLAYAEAAANRGRFALDQSVCVRYPATPKVATGGETAKLLDSLPRPADRVQRLVGLPIVAAAQLGELTMSKNPFGVDVSTALPHKKVMQALQSDPRRPFDEQESDRPLHYQAAWHATPAGAFAMVHSRRLPGVFSREVLMAADGERPSMHAQRAVLVEHLAVAVQPEWARTLPSELFDAAGGLAAQSSLAELDELLELQDPELAVPVGASVWLHQKVEPLTNRPAMYA